MSASNDMLAALSAIYGDTVMLDDPRIAHLVVDKNSVVSRHTIPGVELRVKEHTDHVGVDLIIAQDVRIERPIHTCIGFLAPQGAQNIEIRVHVEPRASASILAHCLFPNAERGSHVMKADVDIHAGAELRYVEEHYHGTTGGMIVNPSLSVQVSTGARYFSDFSLTEGRVGALDIRQCIEAGEDAIAEISARVSGRGTDEIRIRDELVLAGRASRGLIKTRIALAEDARADVVSITRGQAEGARGHMDCLELVRDRAQARAEPIVDVSHPLAKITHEAAVGTVDQNQLETLMAHGLTPDEAIELIVTGILR